MNLELDNKLALVSGSTAGIGFAIAELLLRERARDRQWTHAGRRDEALGALATYDREPAGVGHHGSGAAGGRWDREECVLEKKLQSRLETRQGTQCVHALPRPQRLTDRQPGR